eukprot:Gb_11440 [translate_table: standard]
MLNSVRSGFSRSCHASSSRVVTTLVKERVKEPCHQIPRAPHAQDVATCLNLEHPREIQSAIPMAPKAAAFDLPAIFNLEFIDTHFGRELLANNNLKNYNDIYYLVEKEKTLFTGEEEISEDDVDYKSDLLSIKAAGLHKIATKPKPDMVYNADTTKAFMRGKELVKTVLKDLAERPKTFKKRANLDYPISQFRRGIIMNDRKPDLSKILAFNLHTNWGIAKPGRSFFMASYIVDACCAYLEFNHPLFPTWPHPSDSIHVLFGALYVHKYRRHIIPICTHFYPSIYRAIHGEDMPRISKEVKRDLSPIGAWWYFREATIIRVEGTLTLPTILPPCVPDRLAALEVARQCHFECRKENRDDEPTPTFTIPIEYRLPTLLTASEASAALGFSNIIFDFEELAMTSALGSSDPFSITEESTMAPPTITTEAMLLVSDSPVSFQSTAATSSDPLAQALSKQQWIHMQLGQVKRMDTMTPRHPEMTLEYDKSTSNLKKVTKRRIKTGEQVTTLQTEENLLSLTKKRKRGAKGAAMDDRELVVDPVSIVRSANKMSEEVMERMQMELEAKETNMLLFKPSQAICFGLVII